MKEELKEFREKTIKLACSVYGLNPYSSYKVLIETDGNIVVIYNDLNTEITVCLSPDDINNKDFNGTASLLKNIKKIKKMLLD